MIKFCGKQSNIVDIKDWRKGKIHSAKNSDNCLYFYYNLVLTLQKFIPTKFNCIYKIDAFQKE